jgi:hypothetical protein
MTNKPNYPCPKGVTQAQANVIRDAKVAFFNGVFTTEQLLTHNRPIYATIINSKDSAGNTLEQLVGTDNAVMLMTEIMFHLTTGAYHTD